MNLTLEAVRNAARIIEIGLAPSRRPSSQQYQSLIAAYQTDLGGTRTVTRELAAQFGMVVVSVAQEGIVLAVAAERDSIFMPKRSEILKEPGAQARLVRGICNAAILACAYERQQSLLSDAVQTVTVNEVYEVLVSSSAALAKSQDPQYRGLTEAALIVERTKTDSFSPKAQRARKGTLRSWIIEALDAFVDQGQMVKDGEEEGGTYKTLYRLRKLLSEESAAAIADVVREAVARSKAAEDESSGPAPEGPAPSAPPVTAEEVPHA